MQTLLMTDGLAVIFNAGDITLSLNGQKAGTIETIAITISGGGITLSKPVHSTSSVTLKEKETRDIDNDPVDGTLFHGNTTPTTNVVGHFTTVGKKTITIKGTAYDADGNGTDWSHTFTYYVTQPTLIEQKPSTCKV